MQFLRIPLSIALAFSFLTFAIGCQSAPTTTPSVSTSEAVVAPGAKSDQPVATLWVNGMACPQCSYNVDLQLKKVAGVEKVKVDMLTGMVTAYLSPTNPPTREQLTDAIHNTTFTLVRLNMPGETSSPN